MGQAEYQCTLGKLQRQGCYANYRWNSWSEASSTCPAEDASVIRRLVRGYPTEGNRGLFEGSPTGQIFLSTSSHARGASELKQLSILAVLSRRSKVPSVSAMAISHQTHFWSAQIACTAPREARTDKALSFKNCFHCRQKFPVRIYLENVCFCSVA
jgi:hypothetical protein